MEKDTKTFDICIVCALYEEAEAVINEFSAYCHVTFRKAFSGMDRYVYHHTTIRNNRGESLSVLVAWLSESGPTQTGLDLKPFLHEFRPRFVAMTGICAGYRKKVKLGDIVVAQYAYFYEEGKIIREPEGLSRHLPEMKTADPASQVVQYTRGFNEWKEPVREMKRRKLKRELKDHEEPRCVIGPMASGMAVRSDDPFAWLREQYNRNTVALDMEAATFYRALRVLPHIHALVVKGVCDYADMYKNDTYHDYAARASAVYLLSFIQEYVTEQTMPRRDTPSSRAEPESVWKVPYSRNPHFTGRDELLKQLDHHFMQGEQNKPLSTRKAALTQSQAIKGLGGIGKTQIAVEYAYRSRDLDRYAHTLWISAVSEEAIITSFVTIAELLPSFVAKEETDQRKLAEAVKYWLEECEQRWLLIFDNADDLPIIQQYLPQRGKGDILLTTRANAVGSLATSLEVETMGLMEGTQLLLHRALGFHLDHTSDQKVNEAVNVVIALDHFPLALDQAGAYIEETKCSFIEYLQLYQTCRKTLLTKRGLQMANYPESVATTWLLSFQKVEQANPAAIELLHLCAFLAPDMIPEELIREGATHWTPPLQQAARDLFTFNQLIAELLKFSLVKRLTETQALSIHRLVQVVQKDMIKPDVQCQWAERVVRGVNEVFPLDLQNAALWPQCLRYLDQAQTCYMLIEHYQLQFTEAADLLHRICVYLNKHALYTLAEPLYQKALSIIEQLYGAQHPDTATSLGNLAAVYQAQGKYEQAEPLNQQALSIFKQCYGAQHPDVARALNDLAALNYDQKKYKQAESLNQQALSIFKQCYGDQHPDTATSLGNLAAVYQAQGKYKQAESLNQQALSIFKQCYGDQHPDVAHVLENLAGLYQTQGKYEQAEPLYQQALSIIEQLYGAQHPRLAPLLNNLAVLYQAQSKHKQAESLYQQALSIIEQHGTEHPGTTDIHANLAVLYQAQGKRKQAAPFSKQPFFIFDPLLEAEHPDTATKTVAKFNDLAEIYWRYDLYEQAELFSRQALSIIEQQLGAEHPYLAQVLTNLASIYKEQGKFVEAEQLYQRAIHISEQQLGAEHLDIANALNGLASVYKEQGRFVEAEQLYQRVIHISELLRHPNLILALNGLASVYKEQGKLVEAKQLYQRAIHISKQTMGPKAPRTQAVCANYASLSQEMRLKRKRNRWKKILDFISRQAHN